MDVVRKAWHSTIIPRCLLARYSPYPKSGQDSSIMNKLVEPGEFLNIDKESSYKMKGFILGSIGNTRPNLVKLKEEAEVRECQLTKSIQRRSKSRVDWLKEKEGDRL